MKIRNPFHLKGYMGSEYFCNREEETNKLIMNAENGVNTTLLSVRRIGKTGLLQHVFEQIKNEKKDFKCIYVDIYATQNVAELTNTIASAVLKVFPRSFGKKMTEALKGFSPTLSYDPLSGQPEMSFSYTKPQQQEQSLKGLFDFVERQKHPVLVAFDEFQQISDYSETNVEAMLRSIVQSLNNVSFIFSGSHQHILSEIFTQTNRPFFASTQLLYLRAIGEQDYATFIKKQFESYNKNINAEAINFILSWTKRHTYYTQALCNKVFALSKKNIKIEHVKEAAHHLLEEQEQVFFQYRNLLTRAQWQLLEAIAKEGQLYHPTAQDFIFQYELGSPAAVKRSLNSLMNKEMIFKTETPDQNYYQVYNCFLSRWLERF